MVTFTSSEPLVPARILSPSSSDSASDKGLQFCGSYWFSIVSHKMLLVSGFFLRKFLILNLLEALLNRELLVVLVVSSAPFFLKVKESSVYYVRSPTFEVDKS